MAGSTGEPPDAPDQPDDINKRLKEIEAELRQAAKFKEPSAAERARKARLADARKASRCRSTLRCQYLSTGVPAQRSRSRNRRGTARPGHC
jgi:hypothetical protein